VEVSEYAVPACRVGAVNAGVGNAVLHCIFQYCYTQKYVAYKHSISEVFFDILAL